MTRRPSPLTMLLSRHTRRREFITLLGGAVAWPVAAHGQQPAIPVIGFLSGVSLKTFEPMVAAFHRGLKETGYVEGQNVTIEYRWAEGQYNQLPSLAADLVGRPVAVIAATGGPDSGLAAKAATPSIPIVFLSGSDPVNAGLVGNLARPEGNATGVTFFADTLMAKRFELMRELVPNATAIAVLINPMNVDAPGQLREVQAAARAARQELRPQREHAKRDRRCLCGTCQTSGRCTSCRRRSNVRESARANRLPGGQLRHSRDV